jgi:hypothetical protein
MTGLAINPITQHHFINQFGTASEELHIERKDTSGRA